MNSFLDTSSVVKLYDPTEAGATQLRQQLVFLGIIYLSTLTEVEFISALSGKQRTGHLAAADASSLHQQFINDTLTYGWVEQTAAVRQLAIALIQKHVNLRALDAIQLASALAMRADIQAFFTHDNRLRAAALVEGLPVR